MTKTPKYSPSKKLVPLLARMHEASRKLEAARRAKDVLYRQVNPLETADVIAQTRIANQNAVAGTKKFDIYPVYNWEYTHKIVDGVRFRIYCRGYRVKGVKSPRYNGLFLTKKDAALAAKKARQPKGKCDQFKLELKNLMSKYGVSK